jgi:hypothetical protein
VAGRVAVAPVKGMEIGARAVQLEQMATANSVDANGNPVQTRPIHLTSGAVDGRYQMQIGEGGLLTSYVELGGSHDSSGTRPDGWAGMGFLRLSTPRLEGSISGRMNSEGWTPLGHTTPTAMSDKSVAQRTWNDARFGTLRDQAQFNATGYPFAWLPVTAMFTRQRAYLPDGSDGFGVIQHAIARIQLNKPGLPATTLQIGSTELDNPNAFQTHKLQGSAQADYDLAPLLSFTRIKRFNVRALYSLSQAETDQSGAFAYGDRVQLMRFEGKLSPTSTESINALFRSREVGREGVVDGPYQRSFYHWELLSGAQSTIIPGIVPKFNYNLFYDDNRMPNSNQSASSSTPTDATGSTTNYWTNTGPACPPLTSLPTCGSAVTPVGPGPMTIQPPTRTVTGSIGGGLGIYPGQWWPKLAPLGLQPSLAVGDSESTVNEVKTTYDRVYDFVGTEVWAGRRLEMMLYQRYRFTKTGSDAHDNGSMLIFQNRIVYRPIFTSPITLLINYAGERNPNDLATNPTAAPWATKQSYQNTLQWLMRWNQILTTRATLYGTMEYIENTFTADANGSKTVPYHHSKYSFGGELQFRVYPLADVSALYIYQSTGILRWFCNGTDAYDAWQFIPAAGVIWRLGDKLYLDAHFNYDRLNCTSGDTCSTTTKISPYLYFTMNL